jgi:ferredoxin--NADP+ reductase
MSTVSLLARQEVDQLRQEHYNAELIETIEIHDELRILRVRPDWGEPQFSPGQYSVLGLGNWEPRVAGVQDEDLDDVQQRKLLKRAYSFSCPMLDADGRLLPPDQCSFLEFYVVLVREGEERPPGLTPRLFALRRGDRLYASPKVTGHYTLDAIGPGDNVIFIATGTGEAPHNAMVADLLSRGHRGRLVSVTCVRRRRDLGYLATYQEVERRYDNYRYLYLTTREPENLDERLPNYVGKRYLQDYFDSGDFERDSGVALDPQHTHVFLCGNPAMIGAPIRGSNNGRYPQPAGMIEILERRGFLADEPHHPGNIHYEKYW